MHVEMDRPKEETVRWHDIKGRSPPFFLSLLFILSWLHYYIYPWVQDRIIMRFVWRNKHLREGAMYCA